MKNITQRLMVIALATASLPVFAADAPKLGVCDANAVFFQCAAVKKFSEHRDARMQEYQKKFSTEEAALSAEYPKVQEKMKLSKEEFDKAQKAFQTKVDAARKNGEEARKTVDKASADAENKVKAEILKIITAMKSEKKLGTILDKGAILVSDEVVDITDDVLKKLDASLKEVGVTIPAVDAKA